MLQLKRYVVTWRGKERWDQKRPSAVDLLSDTRNKQRMCSSVPRFFLSTLIQKLLMTQRVVVIAYRRFGTSYRSHLQGSRRKFWTEHTVHTQTNTCSLWQKKQPRYLAPLLVGLDTRKSSACLVTEQQVCASRVLSVSLLLADCVRFIQTVKGLLMHSSDKQQMHIYMYVQFSIKIFHNYVSVIIVAIVRVPRDKNTIVLNCTQLIIRSCMILRHSFL